MYIRDPLLVLAPHFNHSRLGFLPSIENSNSTIAVAGAEDIAGDLVRGQ